MNTCRFFFFYMSLFYWLEILNECCAGAIICDVTIKCDVITIIFDVGIIKCNIKFGY